MSEAAYASFITIDREATEPFEVGTVQWLRRPGDGDRGDLAAGYWFITPEETPGPMTITGHADETVHILEGHVTVAVDGGPTLDLRSGSSASINRGVVAVWTVHEPTIEFFVYS